MTSNLLPPIANKIPKKLRKHNDIRIDDYYWLNNRENPEVIDYLNQENDYYRAMTGHTVDFQKQLFEEMKARIKEDDESVPYFYNEYYYLTRFEKGQDYPISYQFRPKSSPPRIWAIANINPRSNNDNLVVEKLQSIEYP